MSSTDYETNRPMANDHTMIRKSKDAKDYSQMPYYDSEGEHRQRLIPYQPMNTLRKLAVPENGSERCRLEKSEVINYLKLTTSGDKIEYKTLEDYENEIRELSRRQESNDTQSELNSRKESSNYENNSQNRENDTCKTPTRERNRKVSQLQKEQRRESPRHKSNRRRMSSCHDTENPNVVSCSEQESRRLSSTSAVEVPNTSNVNCRKVSPRRGEIKPSPRHEIACTDEQKGLNCRRASVNGTKCVEMNNHETLPSNKLVTGDVYTKCDKGNDMSPYSPDANVTYMNSVNVADDTQRSDENNSTIYDNNSVNKQSPRSSKDCCKLLPTFDSKGSPKVSPYRDKTVTADDNIAQNHESDTRALSSNFNAFNSHRLSSGKMLIKSESISPSRDSCNTTKSTNGDKDAYKIAPVGELDERLFLCQRGKADSGQGKSSPGMAFGRRISIQMDGRSRKSSLMMDNGSMAGSIKGSLQIEDESKKSLREDDCAMSTILQPTAMLRREIALHDACKSKKVEMVVKILQDKIDINCKNNLDRTPLHWACAKGHLQVVEILVDHGADLEAKDKYGMRPVLWAALYGHIDVVQLLVNAGACVTCTNKQGMGLLHCATQNNHIHVMNFIFESLENVDINCAEKHDKTALHIAAEEGHLDAVMRLIDLRCDINRRDSDCCSALHLAAKRGHNEVVKRLLMVGVNVDDREAEGRTALHFAADEGHLETVEVLADFNAGADAETIKETTPLLCAAAKGHTEVCLRLIKLGANINSQNHQGNTALHLSVIGNYRDLTQVLVESKADIDVPNHRLQTPLHVAVECGYQDVVEVLLVGDASLSAREKSGKSALHLAARGSFVTIVDMIIKAERYFSMNREYHENDLDFVDPHRYLRQPSHPSWPQMKEMLWTLATKNLKPADWKKLAVYWKFTPDHIRCIEHQYTGTASYKEHGFRLLMIWLHGVRKDENVTKLLFEGLVGIERRSLAEQIRRWSNCEPEKPCIKVLCGII